MNEEFVLIAHLFLRDASDDEKIALIPLLGNACAFKGGRRQEASILQILHELKSDANAYVATMAATMLDHLRYSPREALAPLAPPEFDVLLPSRYRMTNTRTAVRQTRA